ncbi:MAG: hypothetical protein ACP5E3_02000, partial [Bacteroidales bacterium]
MKRGLLIFAVCCLITVNSCHDQTGFKIIGKVTGFSDSTMVYLKNRNLDKMLDSTLIIKNSF